MTPDDKKLWEKVTKSVSAPLSQTVSVSTQISQTRVWERWFMFTTLDLHGMTLNEAHSQTISYIKHAKQRRLKYVKIITGLSGQIKREFPFWIDHLPEIRKVEVLNGGGAFKVFLKK